MVQAGTLRAAALYFLLVFAAGWILGPIRVLVLVPRFGPTIAVLCEAPLMLAAMVFAARWVVRRLCVPARPGTRLAIGLAALALLLAAELAGSLLLRGLTLTAWLGGFTTPAGLITLLLYLLFAVMPALVLKRW